jgi:hypothetical protein
MRFKALVVFGSGAALLLGATALGQGSGKCSPAHCLEGTHVLVKHTAVGDNPDGFALFASGRLKANNRACLHRRTVTLYFKWRGHPKRVRDVDTTSRHSAWAVMGRSNSKPREAFVKVSKKIIYRHHRRAFACANDAVNVYSRPPQPPQR